MGGSETILTLFEFRNPYGKMDRPLWQKLCIKIIILCTLFAGFCASYGINFGQNFVSVRVAVRMFCTNEGRGSVANIAGDSTLFSE